MSRVARVVVPGIPHHVTQRGNRGADVFETDEDKKFYLAQLAKYMNKYGASLWAYCLMPNHLHLVVVPENETSLGRIVRDTHTVYAMHANGRSETTGHVWQGRYLSCPMDDGHLWAAVRYVERNPVRAGLVERAEDYTWSSAPTRCSSSPNPLLAADFPPRGVVSDWSNWLRDEDEALTSAVRRHTRTGRPCGSPAFIERLEKLLDRKLAPKKPGRKPGQRPPAAD